MDIMKNKMQSKKSKPSERALKKKQEKKMKKARDQKNKLVSAAKSIKNEKVKEGKVKVEAEQDTKDGVLDAADVKPDVKPAKVYNEEGKIVFSKFEFAARPSLAKKTKKDSERHWNHQFTRAANDIHFIFYFSRNCQRSKTVAEENQKTEGRDFRADWTGWDGEGRWDQEGFGVAKSIREDRRKEGKWSELLFSLPHHERYNCNRFPFTQVKDNATMLLRAVRKKKTEKKKSKTEWKKREQKVEKDQEGRAKKREANLSKKSDEKKKHKLKKMAKRGRVIPGY